jgi:hypothetical protein
MARPILVAARFFASAFVLFLVPAAVGASSVEGQVTQCSSDPSAQVSASRQKEVRDFQGRIESGPFFKELLRRFRKLERCEIGLEDAGIRLSYVFGENARLDARANPVIEFSEQNMQLQGIKENSAVSLLKKTEKESFGGGGCGIKWDHPIEDSSKGLPRSRDIVYRGDICNCQGRVIHMGNRVVALVFRSAC